jgi:crossover junction endodeoxyribonuclease RuvC
VRIVGLDPGSRNTGYGIIEKEGTSLRALAFGRLSCSPREPLPERINQLSRSLAELLEHWQPTAAALESAFHGLNARSLIVLAQARGALLGVLAQHRIEIREYSPAEIKTAVTGHGRATKEQVARMVQIILTLESGKARSDASDALAAAICCAQRERYERLARP